MPVVPYPLFPDPGSIPSKNVYNQFCSFYCNRNSAAKVEHNSRHEIDVYLTPPGVCPITGKQRDKDDRSPHLALILIHRHSDGRPVRPVVNTIPTDPREPPRDPREGSRYPRPDRGNYPRHCSPDRALQNPHSLPSRPNDSRQRSRSRSRSPNWLTMNVPRDPRGRDDRRRRR